MKNIIKKREKGMWRQWLPFYILLIPAVVVVFLFSYMPMSGILLAFKDYNPKLGIFESPWTDFGGFGNFVEVFKTPAITQAIWNTLYINIISLVLSFFMPIILALLLTEVRLKPLKKIMQTISYLPYFLSWAAVCSIVNNLFSEYGIINSVLYNLGLDPVFLLENANAFIPTYWIVTIWKSVGWGSIIYLATISGISMDLYEAASIDGAGRFMQAIHVTIPGIIPTAMIQLILSVGGLFSSNFELVYGLQNPIAWTMEVISTATYKYGIGGGTASTYGVSVALGLMEGVVAVILTFSVNAISNKVSKISMW